MDTKCISDFNAYKCCRNKVKALVKDIYKNEQINIARDCKSNPKRFWNYVTSKTKSHQNIAELKYINDSGIQVKASSDQDKANVLSNYFSTVFNNDFSDGDFINDSVPTTEMDQIDFSIADIVKRLGNLNVNKSAGPDQLHPRVLKEVRNKIAYPIKKLFECSLNTNALPTDWRSGNITPIYKKGSKSAAQNYRPVCLTSIISKLLESVIRDNILNHFFTNNLFSNKQHGFLKGRSTVTQLLKILDEWTERLEEGGQIDVIYTDLEKAFDKVPHKLLIKKTTSVQYQS